MHPPSPILPENDYPQKVLHIIQDIRNLRLEDNQEQLLDSAVSWSDFCKLTERHCPSAKPENETATTEDDSLHPAMAKLTLNEDADTVGDGRIEGVYWGQPTRFQTNESHVDISFSTTFVDDLHILFPRPTGTSVIPDDGVTRPPPAQMCSSMASGLSNSSRVKKQRRRRRRLAPSSQLTSAILSLDYTRKPTPKCSQRKPFYQAIRPPSIASFLHSSIPRGRLSSPSLPHHSQERLDSITMMAGYPTYITALAAELGEGDNAYPLWYLLLTFWFPEQEGFEVVNHWTPRMPGNEGPGSEIRVFAPIEATLAVLWLGSPVCVVQIAPSQSSGIALTRTETVRSAERLFDDAALYSELPTLCVLEVQNKQFWGGFVRSTDATPELQSLQEHGRDWDWFGPGWEKDVMDMDGTRRSEGQLITSWVAFELLGRCFSALKANCVGAS